MCDGWRGQRGEVREDGIALNHSSSAPLLEPEASPEVSPPTDEEPAASSAAPAEPAEPAENGETTESSAEPKDEEEGAEKKEWVSQESGCVCVLCDHECCDISLW